MTALVIICGLSALSLAFALAAFIVGGRSDDLSDQFGNQIADRDPRSPFHETPNSDGAQ